MIVIKLMSRIDQGLIKLAAGKSREMKENKKPKRGEKVKNVENRDGCIFSEVAEIESDFHSLFLFYF